MTKQMTSRERVATALNHQEPDRVPLDIGAGQSTGLVAEAYENLQAYTGITGAGGWLSKTFRVARLDDATLARLGSDVRPLQLRPPRNWQPPASEDGTFIDELGIKWQQAPLPGRGYYWEQITFPLAEATIADLDRYPWPDPHDPGRYAGLAEEAADLYHNTPYAILGDCGFKNHWEPVFLLCGMERALTDVVDNPAFTLALLERIAGLNVAVTRRFLEATGKYLTAIRTSDDLATQSSLMMSPAAYRKLVKPYHQRYFRLIKEYTEAKIFFHSCGNIVPLLDDLIEAGVEALNPVQVSAFKDPAEVKRVTAAVSPSGAASTRSGCCPRQPGGRARGGAAAHSAVWARRRFRGGLGAQHPARCPTPEHPGPGRCGARARDLSHPVLTSDVALFLTFEC